MREADRRDELLQRIGTPKLAPATVPFDPGYDPSTVESHLDQSAHLMAMLKLSMTCWLIASPDATRQKVATARAHGIPIVSGGGPFEIAAATGVLPAYLDLCAELGFAGVEAGEGFTELPIDPATAVELARDRTLELQFEVGEKHGGNFTHDTINRLIESGMRWLDAGACRIVVEARESATDVGLFRPDGTFDAAAADRFADAFGLARVVFEAPTKASQFALLNHFGPHVVLGNVRLEELLRVEIYRRGLHADAFNQPRLSPLLHQPT
jgi:phosphosulfolactate synthase